MSEADNSIGDGLYDPRAVGNLILELIHRPVTNLALQKLLYFVHGAYIARNKKSLITGYFEAWTHGPVHPAVYSSFKEFEGREITRKATKKDLRTGEITDVAVPNDDELLRLCKKVLGSLEDFTAGQLVALSHARGGPWDLVYKRSKRERMLGLRISNETIRDLYKNHWVSAERLEKVDEPTEDTPLTYYRFG